MILPEINLLLVFSSGVSLKLWKTTGLFDREIGYYLELRKKINSISFLTYDEEINDLKTSNREVNSFNLLYNKNRIYYKFFGLLSPLIFRSEIKKMLSILLSNHELCNKGVHAGRTFDLMKARCYNQRGG